MTVSVHNPDQYMASLRQIIAQGRKRIGLPVWACALTGIFPPGSGNLRGLVARNRIERFC